MIREHPEQVLDSRIIVPHHVRYRVFATKTILADLRRGRYHELNNSGGRMLQAIEDSEVPRQAIGTLAAEFRQPEERVREDVVSLIASLVSAGLVEFDGESPIVVKSKPAGVVSSLLAAMRYPYALGGATAAGPFPRIRLVVEIAATYFMLRLRFQCKGLDLAEEIARLGSGRESDGAAERSDVLALRLGMMVSRTLTAVPTGSTCLLRSLVLLRVLARRGVQACLVIAVTHEREPFAAHAWVERGGLALLDPGKPGLAPLLRMHTSPIR